MEETYSTRGPLAAGMETRWWGWGDASVRYPAESLDPVLAYLETEGLSLGPPLEPPDLPDLPPSRIDPDRDPLDGLGEVSTDPLTRASHSLGQGYLDLLRARQSVWQEATDLVVFPREAAEVRTLLRRAGDRGWAVVPYGGGTSVLGGVRPLAGGHRAVVTVDLRHLNRVREVRSEDGLVRVEAGLRGPALEDALEAHGFTLGHFPQSFHHSTVGGWIATRSSGHLSGRYGDLAELVRSLRVVTPRGDVETRTVPSRATGPELRELFVGSEGILGIIVEAVLRVRPRPEAREGLTFLAPSFGAALSTCRDMVQSGPGPALVRISDEAEAEALAAARGLDLEDVPSLVLLEFQGTERAVRDQGEDATGIWTDAGSVGLDRRWVDAWREEYYRSPYLRDELFARGLLVETLETAAPWSRLEALHHGVRGALHDAFAREGEAGLVLCHLSHAYPDGGSLYFTLLTPRTPGDAAEQWHRLKAVATEAVLAQGGTLSHHHGIGVDHRAWMEREHGPTGVRVLQALKRSLDPAGILNPGKVVEKS